MKKANSYILLLLAVVINTQACSHAMTMTSTCLINLNLFIKLMLFSTTTQDLLPSAIFYSVAVDDNIPTCDTTRNFILLLRPLKCFSR